MVQPDLSARLIRPLEGQRLIEVLHSIGATTKAAEAIPRDRNCQCAALHRLLASARRGVGGALVLRGESATDPTMGACASGQAAEMRVLLLAGVISEAGLPYAALHQLLLPFVPPLDRLPGPQRTALRAAFGLVEARPPDFFVVGVAVLTLLSGLGVERPLLVAVDDGQWLDRATARVLAFVGRRLRNSPVALVVAVREPHAGPRSLRGLPEVSPTGLSDGGQAECVGAPGLVAVRDPITVRRRSIGPVADHSEPEVDRPLHTTAAAVRKDTDADTNVLQLFKGGLPGQSRPVQTGVLDALYAALVAGRLAPSGALEDTTRAARAWLTSLNRSPGAGELLLDGFVVRLTAGHPPAVPAFRAGLTRLLGEEAGVRHPAGTFALATWAAGELLDTRAQEAVARRWSEAAGGQSEPGQPPFGSSMPHAWGAIDDLLWLAWRGDEHDARTAAADQIRSGIARGVGLAVTTAHYASTILDLGLGHYDAALASALTVYDDDPPDLGTQVLPDLIEAAVRAGNPHIARSALERLSERALADDTPLARGLLARSRALTAADGAAENLYREAVDELALSRSDLQLARARLLYGEWLRRRRRRRDARAQLTTACDTFALAGAGAFARRARVEADATGERVGKRTHPAVDQRLTPQEAAVTRLVIEGSSNREVAAALFISINTVEYHLGKVFRKVGVSSRTQLTRTLLDGGKYAAVLTTGSET
jgi:DNA-binding CsgD family transcriptional regulator